MKEKEEVNLNLFVASCLFILAAVLFTIKVVLKPKVVPKKKKEHVEYTYLEPKEVKPINENQKDYYEAVYSDSIVED